MHPKSISTLDRPFTNGITDDEDFPPLPPTVTSVPSIPQFYDHTESSEDPFTATEVL